jgi:predicted DNA-binding protein (MmcQ/YjbR family)
MSSQDTKANKATRKPGTRAKAAQSANAAAYEAMRSHGLSYPEVTEDFPWDHLALKVKGKAFVFVGSARGADELSFSVKLPRSRDVALMLPFATPTGYGLGKSGWVSASFPAGAKPPVDMILDWMDESYRAIAPKKLVARLGVPRAAADAGTSGAEAPAKKAVKKTAKAGAPAKKAAKPDASPRKPARARGAAGKA